MSNERNSLTVKQKSQTLLRRHIVITLRVKLEDQDKPFTPYVCYKICVENLRGWRNSKRNGLEGRKLSHFRLLFLHGNSQTFLFGI